MSATAKDCGFPKSSLVNFLLGFDDDSVDKEANKKLYVESQMESSNNDGNGNMNKVNHNVHSVPDSPMLEANYSFGSAYSSLSVAKPAPIRVRDEDNQKIGRLGIEEQFQQNVVVVGVGENINLPQK
ncbi:uncharacterized protein Fot_02511 [Forsythia ovata]|uniref:Uncharacterized protein n=1 Tax=Forsythia ovata TaxID=205694 RepID=A0ABD1X722_9LAMI